MGEYTSFVIMGAVAFAAVIAGIVIRLQNRSKRTAASNLAKKGSKVQYVQDTGRMADDGDGGVWTDAALMELSESENTEYYKDDKY